MALEVASAKKGGCNLWRLRLDLSVLRDVINKNVSEEDLERAARNAFENGWNRLKLYFMMGLPTETDDDIRAIPELAERGSYYCSRNSAKRTSRQCFSLDFGCRICP